MSRRSSLVLAIGLACAALSAARAPAVHAQGYPSGIGPRVAEPALMLINPYPWSASLEEVRLKRP